MKVRYEIIVEVTADGMLGPLKVLEMIRWNLTAFADRKDRGGSTLDIGHVRIAAVYPLAQAVEERVDAGVQGGSPSRPLTEKLIRCNHDDGTPPCPA